MNFLRFFSSLIFSSLLGSASAFGSCFYDNTASSFVTPEKYAKLPNELITKLRTSYFRHTVDNKYLDNAFWSSDPNNKCSWPKTLWEALDQFNYRDLNTLVSIYHRTKDTNTWHLIRFIKWTWFSTSHGFTFDTIPNFNEKDLENSLKNTGNYCKDFEFISESMHHGQTCWREIPKNTNHGLHFCFGASKPPEVHFDFNQIPFSKIPFSNYCAPEPIATYRHHKDLNSEIRDTIFETLEKYKANLIGKIKDLKASCISPSKEIYINMLEGIVNIDLNDLAFMQIVAAGTNATEKGIKLIEKLNSRIANANSLMTASLNKNQQTKCQ